FKYSRALARVTGRAPEAILKGPAFDALLPTLVLGSRETAAAVGRLVTAYVAAGRMPIPYLADLLRYEEAMMVVEAGARGWPSCAKRSTGWWTWARSASPPVAEWRSRSSGSGRAPPRGPPSASSPSGASRPISST